MVGTVLSTFAAVQLREIHRMSRQEEPARDLEVLQELRPDVWVQLDLRKTEVHQHRRPILVSRACPRVVHRGHACAVRVPLPSSVHEGGVRPEAASCARERRYNTFVDEPDEERSEGVVRAPNMPAVDPTDCVSTSEVLVLVPVWTMQDEHQL
jgi:hypothetical protein